MNNLDISMKITIFELVSLILTIVAGVFAYYQWQQTNKIKRAKFVEDAYNTIRCNEEITSVLYEIDYGKQWYDESLLHDHKREAKFDQAFAYFDYLVYLKKNRLISENDFRIFKYRITRMARNESFQTYLFNLYHFSKKNKTPMSFSNLLDYLKENDLLRSGFFDVYSKNFRKVLNI